MYRVGAQRLRFHVIENFPRNGMKLNKVCFTEYKISKLIDMAQPKIAMHHHLMIYSK